MKSKYNFDIDFLSSLNLSCKKYTLDFIIKGHFYGPVKTDEIISKAQVDLATIKPINIGTIPPTIQ